MCFGMAKICDFGWSTSIKSTMRETFCGTPLYVSPELLSGNSYDEKIDMWSIGILGYEMMTGSIPFRIGLSFELILASQSGFFQFPKSKIKVLWIDFNQDVVGTDFFGSDSHEGMTDFIE